MIPRGLLIIVLLIVLPLQLHAVSPSYFSRHLSEENNASSTPIPSDGGVGLAFNGSNFQQSCNMSSRSCQLNDIAACLTYSQNGTLEETSLFVLNNGTSNNTLHVKIIILSTNNTIEEIDLPTNQTKKITIPSDVDLNDAITLNSTFGDCVLRAVEAPAPEIIYQNYPSNSTYITPVNGAYFVILVFIIGGALTFVKLRVDSRHRGGVPYRELEMENSSALSSMDLEGNGKGNWDEDWDGDWVDKKQVKSGGENPVKVEQSNGLNLKIPNSNGRRKEWDD